MLNLYERNGVPFWDEEAIEAREILVRRFCRVLFQTLRAENRAFSFHQVEAPLLTPVTRLNPEYQSSENIDKLFAVLSKSPDSSLETVLRPETTMGSYAYARHLMESQGKLLPTVIWQHGKSFRHEQDQVTKNMRLKEFYQLEFQILFAESTKNDYAEPVRAALTSEMSRLLGPCHLEASDRVPGYSEQTDDIVLNRNQMEMCSISRRTDFDGAKNLEVAIGTDRCLVAYLERGES